MGSLHIAVPLPKGCSEIFNKHLIVYHTPGTVLDMADQVRNKSHFLSSGGSFTRRKETDIQKYTSTKHCIREGFLEKMPNGDLMDKKGFTLQT